MRFLETSTAASTTWYTYWLATNARNDILAKREDRLLKGGKNTYMTSKWNDPTRSLDISTKMTITRRPHSMPKFWAWLMGLQNVQPNDANTKKVGGFTLSSPSNRKASISENKAETRPTFRTNPSHRTIITFKTWNTSHLHPLWELPCSIRFLDGHNRYS